jgi:hypothetical protein
LDKGKDTFCVLDKERYYSRTIISAILALLMTIFTIAGLSQYYNNVKVVNRIYSSDVVSDIRKLMRSYPDSTIGMGYGGDVSLTYYRPVLVFAGNPYFVDSAALTDMQFSSHGLSSKTLDALNSCRIKIWLIPKNGKPFEIDNYYQSSKPLFSAQFKTIFSERYELRDQTKYFDVWFCKSLDFVH